MLLISPTLSLITKMGVLRGFFLFPNPYFYHMELRSVNTLTYFLFIHEDVSGLNHHFKAITFCLAMLRIGTNLILVPPRKVDAMIPPVWKMGKLRHTVAQRLTEPGFQSQWAPESDESPYWTVIYLIYVFYRQEVILCDLPSSSVAFFYCHVLVLSFPFRFIFHRFGKRSSLTFSSMWADASVCLSPWWLPLSSISLRLNAVTYL